MLKNFSIPMSAPKPASVTSKGGEFIKTQKYQVLLSLFTCFHSILVTKFCHSFETFLPSLPLPKEFILIILFMKWRYISIH